MKRFLSVAVMLGLLGPTGVWASDKLFLLKPIEADSSAPYPENIKRECALEMLLENYTLSEFSRKGEVQAITALNDGQDGKVLNLTILAVHGYGGGSWSGSKGMTIRVDVKQGDATLKSTVLDRSSRGGFFGGVKGTCAIFDRVTKVLAQDLSRWYFGSSNAKPVIREEQPPVEQSTK